MKSFFGKKVRKKCLILFFAIATSLTLLNGLGQQKHSIKGQLKDQQSMQTIAYATVALRRISDSTLITGTARNPNGEFILASVPMENILL